MKRREHRTVLTGRKAASVGPVSSADRAYMKAPSPVPRRASGHFVQKWRVWGKAIPALLASSANPLSALKSRGFIPALSFDFLYSHRDSLDTLG